MMAEFRTSVADGRADGLGNRRIQFRLRKFFGEHLLHLFRRIVGGRHAQRFHAAGHVLLILDLRVLFANAGQGGANVLFIHPLREAEGRAVAADGNPRRTFASRA